MSKSKTFVTVPNATAFKKEGGNVKGNSMLHSLIDGHTGGDVDVVQVFTPTTFLRASSPWRRDL